jgi:hypothetical protein
MFHVTFTIIQVLSIITSCSALFYWYCHETSDSAILVGRPIIVDFSPVTDFREATCRQYEENVCNRGGYCNFMHLKKISRFTSQHSSFHDFQCFYSCIYTFNVLALNPSL